MSILSACCPRFYIPDVDAASAQFDLPEDEAAHLVRVLRLGDGDAIEVFDGRGGAWKADVIRTDKHSATVRRHAPVDSAAETRVPVSLVISVPKAGKMDDIVRDAVMIGAAAIRPVTSARSEANRDCARRRPSRRAMAAHCRVVGEAVPASGRADRSRRRVAGAVPRRAARRRPHHLRRARCRRYQMRGRHMTFHDLTPPMSSSDPRADGRMKRCRRRAPPAAMPMTLGSRVLRADTVPLIALTALVFDLGRTLMKR